MKQIQGFPNLAECPLFTHRMSIKLMNSPWSSLERFNTHQEGIECLGRPSILYTIIPLRRDGIQD